MKTIMQTQENLTESWGKPKKKQNKNNVQIQGQTIEQF